MQIIYSNNKTERLCTSIKTAKKEMNLDGVKLIEKIRIIENAKNLMDIVHFPTLNFHGLRGNRKGQFAIDVNGRKSNYRIILEPLDENRKRYKDFRLDLIGSSVEVILILEVSDHYE